MVARSSAQDAPPWEVPAAHGAMHVGAAHVGVKRLDPAVCVRTLGHSVGYTPTFRPEHQREKRLAVLPCVKQGDRGRSSFF